MIWVIAALAGIGIVAAIAMAQKPRSGASGLTISNNPVKDTPLARLVSQEAANNGLKPALVMAVIDRESGFNVTARGSAGEVGLMQIRQGALDDYNRKKSQNLMLTDLFTPSLNVKVGCWYLGWLKRNYTLNDSQTLQAYNGGIGNFLKERVSTQALEYAKDVLAREVKFA